MTQAFPYVFEPDEAGGVLVQFVDVPEANTFGATEKAAGEQALDCLIAALGGYMKLGRKCCARARRAADRSRSCRRWSRPSSAVQAMRAQDITRTELARRLGLQENAVRRLLDLDHRSHIDQLDRALATLGKRLEVRILQPA